MAAIEIVKKKAKIRKTKGGFEKKNCRRTEEFFWEFGGKEYWLNLRGS